MPNPFVRVGQLKRTEDDIRDDLGIHLTNSISFGPCRTSNNGRVTNCHCVQNIRGDSVLQKNILKCLYEYNSFDVKNHALFIQGIVLHGSIVSQRRKRRETWSPEFHPKGVLDEQETQMFFVEMGYRNSFVLDIGDGRH